MRKITIVILVTLLTLHCKAQDSLKNPLINSGDIIGQGISYHDKELFDSALSQYNLVDRNDTNYTLALYEKSYSLLRKKDYAGSIKASTEALNYPYEETAELYVNLATALNDSGNTEASLRVFNQAIGYYPYLFLIRNNMASALHSNKNDKEAIFQYQKSIHCNPFHASNYWGLGKLYYSQGRKIPAMLCFGLFLVIEPNTERALSVTKLMKKIADGSIDQDKEVKAITTDEDKAYVNVTEILDSKLSLDKRYKTGVEINDALVRQFHVILDNIKYDEKDTSFLSKYIVSFLKPMFTSGRFEAFAYNMFGSYNNKAINTWVKKNAKAGKDFKQWSSQTLVSLHSTKTMNVAGKATEVHCYYRNNGMLQSFGVLETKDGKELKHGLWTYINTNGTIETTLTYNEKGEADGQCKVWSKNRRLLKENYFKNDEQDGPYVHYFDNGNVKFKATYVKGKLQGKLYKYYNTGSLKAIENVVNDTLNGLATYFNRNGDKSAVLKYVHAELDSVASYFYPSGKLKSSILYKHDKYNGQSISYYENGQVESKGEYQDGHEIGAWLLYWENGKVKIEEQFSKDGLLQGVYKQYNDDGVLMQESMYEKNKLNGKSTIYNDDASLWYTVDYKKGNIKKLINYTSKSGAVCAEFESRGKRLQLTFMTPQCQKSYEGEYFKGNRNGTWKHYYANGNKSIDERYSNGVREGLYTNYFKNGLVDTKITYSNDLKNGYYNGYYQNGALYSEGWYRNGQKQGYWFFYNPDGIKTKTFYYLDDHLRGYQSYYNNDGKLDYEMYYRDGLTEKYIYHDTSGKVAYENTITNGNGHIVATYFNGQKRFEGEMTNGNFNGDFKRFYSNGALLEECTYHAGNLVGQQKQYHRNGSVLKDVFYVENEEDGKAFWYYENGNVETSGVYKKGERQGVWEWFDEMGRKTIQRKYKNGEYNGDQIWYDSTGTAMLKMVFEAGDLLSYSYLDKNTAFLPLIPIQEETAKIKTLYPNGKIAAEIEYQKGLIVGEFRTYYQSGTIMSITPYKDNKVNGMVRKFYESGNTASEVTYFYGNLHGKANYIRPNGSIEKTEYWLMDEKHGTFDYYDTKGNLVKKEKYVYNELFE